MREYINLELIPWLIFTLIRSIKHLLHDRIVTSSLIDYWLKCIVLKSIDRCVWLLVVVVLWSLFVTLVITVYHKERTWYIERSVICSTLKSCFHWSLNLDCETFIITFSRINVYFSKIYRELCVSPFILKEKLNIVLFVMMEVWKLTLRWDLFFQTFLFHRATLLLIVMNWKISNIQFKFLNSKVIAIYILQI